MTDASYNDPIKHGGNWDAKQQWKKLRESHKNPVNKWAPTHWDGGKAGALGREGDTRKVSKELYDLNYDLAFGKITQEDYDKQREELGE
jgi:hypothetical protein